MERQYRDFSGAVMQAKASLLLVLMLALPVSASESLFPRFAQLALNCLHQEYPNHLLHHVSGAGEVGEPHELYPAFYGCFDWHSSVHGHWLLVRLLHLDKIGEYRAPAMAALEKSFQAEKLAGEVTYFNGTDRAGFERPYGRAWFLQLIAELKEWNSAEAQQWLSILQPLEDIIVAQTMAWLPNLAYPVRSGTHNQTAFSFGLMLDYARASGQVEFKAMLVDKIKEFYLDDRACPLAYEPSGEDFLSPCLMEADLVRRVLPAGEFSIWLSAFLPQVPSTGEGDWLAVGVVLDPTDGKLVHLDGLNLSRAWALQNIAGALPVNDLRVRALNASADIHSEAGLAAVTGAHYAGGHWLASFAIYLSSGRGM